MNLPVLPTDIFIIVVKYIGLKEVLTLRTTCKYFRQITQSKSVWHDLLKTEVVQKNIPIPRLGGRHLVSLTTEELEQCLSDALRLRRNWTSGSPVPLHRLSLRTADQLHTQIVSLAFLPSPDRRWLISLSLQSDDGQRIFTLQCWDIVHSNCIAQRRLEDFRGFRINTISSPAAAIALRSSNGLEILGIDFSAPDPGSGFVTNHILDLDESLHIFSASTLLTKGGDNRLFLRTIENPTSPVELRNPIHIEHKELIDAIITDSYVVVARTTELEFYPLVPFRAGSLTNVIEPLTSHTWQWRVDSVSMAFQPSWEGSASPVINILVRYASLFPWPVNALHHYVLPCDGTYDPNREIDALNKPYLPDAVLIRTFASPIRLFARWDMVLGSYGTALWIDSHTEEYFDHAAEGQRLAGTLFTTVDQDAAVAHDPNFTSASMVYQVREDDGWIRIAIQEEEGRIALGTSTAEIVIFQYI
ncbi:F-box domain-containing protein [Favolaschia claudopus]|uniref:F-box domain-containing protein n=1 Tax=Favolaschia claudopus TaxID=2862362 RepID=A0AAV9ZDA9_9AGAR